MLNDMERKIIRGAKVAHARCTLLDVGDIAHAAGVSQSTVRKYLPGLISSGHLKYTMYVRFFGLGPNGHTFEEREPNAC